MTGPDLKPCPFCGGAMPPHDDTGYIRCMGCGAESGWRATPEGAAAAWNTRDPAVIAALPEVQALIAAAIEVVADLVREYPHIMLMTPDQKLVCNHLGDAIRLHPRAASADATAALARIERDAEARGRVKGLREAADIVADVQRQEMSDTEGVMPPDRFDEGTSAAYEAILARAAEIEMEAQ